MAKDFACGLILLALATLYLNQSAQLPQSALGDTVGSDGFPMILGWALAVMSLALLGQAAYARFTSNTDEKNPAFERPLYATLRAAGIVAIGVVFVFFLPVIGYVPSLILLIAAVALYQGQALSWQFGAVAVGGAIGLYLLFVRLLSIPLPPGFWPDLLG